LSFNFPFYFTGLFYNRQEGIRGSQYRGCAGNTEYWYLSFS
jgi:hypothetical protein